jgi:hypothetical protein
MGGKDYTATHFTCFTGTKVQILTQERHAEGLALMAFRKQKQLTLVGTVEAEQALRSSITVEVYIYIYMCIYIYIYMYI